MSCHHHKTLHRKKLSHLFNGTEVLFSMISYYLASIHFSLMMLETLEIS